MAANRRQSLIIVPGIAALLTIIVVGVATFAPKISQQVKQWILLPTPVVTMPTPTTHELTVEKFDDALARWKAHQIEEYEITVTAGVRWSTSATLRVGDNGNRIQVLAAYGPFGVRSLDSIDSSGEQFKYMTVESMFNALDNFLSIGAEAWSNNELNDALRISSQITDKTSIPRPKITKNAQRLVAFDPELGYPVLISVIPSEYDTLVVFHRESAIYVSRLIVLKSGTQTTE